MEILRALGYVVLAYLICGVIAAIAMHLVGLRRIDRATIGAGVLFRALITPGLVALWPIVIVKLIRGSGAGPLESPLSARGLRSLHGLAIATVSIIVPLAAGVAIWHGPSWSPANPTANANGVSTTGVAWSWTNEPGTLSAHIPESLAAPRLIYWSPSATDAPSARVFLRAMDGFGTFSIPLPQAQNRDAGTIWIYGADTGTWERALNLGIDA